LRELTGIQNILPLSLSLLHSLIQSLSSNPFRE
jgi:hypothetical protein